MNKPNKIITHTAVSAKHHNHLDVGQWHLDRWNGYSPSTIRTDVARYAGYHFIINWDGSWEQIRAFTDEGIHCRGQNFSSIGVCFMGDGDKHLPSAEQKKAWVEVYKLIARHCPEISPNDVYPHRRYSTKTCHGKLLADDYFIKLLVPEDLSVMKATIRRLEQEVSRLISLLTKRRML